MTRDATDDAPGEALSELAQLILNVSRLVRARTPAGSEVVALTDTERTVMRLVEPAPRLDDGRTHPRPACRHGDVRAELQSLEGKGMLTRPTPRPSHGGAWERPAGATNLAVLRAAWARELAGVLGDRRGGQSLQRPVAAAGGTPHQ